MSIWNYDWGDLQELASWLEGLRVERIAMEASGVYGKPVGNLLEARNKFHWLLVNGQRVKQVPGRKTDQKDREWIADVLPHGMLKGSFLPPPPIRGLRDRTRPRAKIRQTMAAFANRVQKVWEDANLKLGSVASEALGVSGGRMLKALIAGPYDPKQLAQMGCGRFREKTKKLELA